MFFQFKGLRTQEAAKLLEPEELPIQIFVRGDGSYWEIPDESEKYSHRSLTGQRGLDSSDYKARPAPKFACSLAAFDSGDNLLPRPMPG